MDAFSNDWSKFHFYAFPPFSLIPQYLQKIQQDKGKSILIVPVWPTVTFQPTIPQTSSTHILQQTAAITPETPLNGMSANWNSFQQYNVSKEVIEVLMASWRPGTKKQYSTYLNKCLEFCSKRTDYSSQR